MVNLSTKFEIYISSHYLGLTMTFIVNPSHYEDMN